VASGARDLDRIEVELVEGPNPETSLDPLSARCDFRFLGGTANLRRSLVLRAIRVDDTNSCH
jgi:hypothetical protein